METIGDWTAGIIELKTEHVLWIGVIVQNKEGWAINLYIVIVCVIEGMSFKFVFSEFLLLLFLQGIKIFDERKKEK